LTCVVRGLVDAAQSCLNGILTIGLEQPVAQNPVALDLPRELGDVDASSHSMADRGARSAKIACRSA
jgi:hypothetical protein